MRKIYNKQNLISLKDKLLIIIRNGGIKLKLIGFAIGTIITTVVISSFIIINLMTDSIEKKSFDVVTSSIHHISNFSRQALLERTYENKLNLSELVNKIEQSNIDGFIDISIYEREKKENKNQFKYLTGFQSSIKTQFLEDKELIEQLNKINSESILQKDITINNNIKAYQFTRPILYTFKNQTFLLGAVVLKYDKQAIYGVINQVIYIAIFTTFIFILIATAIVYFFGLKFTRPILDITEAANKVSKGDLNIEELNSNSYDEIGTLAERFNSMVNGLRERNHMEKFVSNSTISMIQEDTKKQLLLGGEYRTQTFLFSDIRGFTQMSEEKSPSEVVEIVNFYLNLQAEIIKKNNGDIDKFIGDEVMASFSGEKSLHDAVNAAIEIQNIIKTANEQRKEQDKVICCVGIGINKGEVIVGNVGANERMDFTSMGSHVNLAARLCSNAKENEILIANTNLENIQNDFETKTIDSINAKGFSQDIEVSLILSKRDI
ncbi:hypothetical protein CRV01_00925 [Arcobacter sp. CECT 8983]|uniref:adenylate/guanylate cyclase domain-containing protein n=1 Tax=Arcobacter sp. CECT 8983 TaxID=2044508 RepID=UPI00100C2E58|nr:adenylate/guanylate cyclase domain-containing protein [Arcobacter sp. CECT 8983]RXJ91687.1 hypothetical protein CRV01_00925 [Arcobacter sp. CECT 8983]